MYKLFQGKFSGATRFFKSAVLNKVRQAKSSGFTLIELLLVIAILGVIATVVFVNLNPAGNLLNSRNSRRITDINTIESALQNYILANGSAPASVSALVPAYIGSLPVDPTNSGNYVYYYCAGTATGSYALGATLEAGSNTAALMTSSSSGVPAGCTLAAISGSGTAGTCGTSPFFCHRQGS